LAAESLGETIERDHAGCRPGRMGSRV
jgi:hypothetical protein